MSAIFLHGGGTSGFRPFLEAVPGKILLVMLASPEAAEHFALYQQFFAAEGFNQPAECIEVSPEKPLTLAQLQAIAPQGLFLCGGLTPGYHAALCEDQSWLAYLRDMQIPYCGTSAGAAIAAEQAIIGGWQAHRVDQITQVIYQGAGEDLDPITVKKGLGLVPFSVDVHASQWGTLTRLLHAVDLGLVQSGWAIDENTLLTAGETIAIYGKGQAYAVSPTRQVTIHLPPSKG